MENVKKIFTEATIVSVVVIYSYFVYLIGEIGYLNAYGISDAAPLVTLELQNVIFGFLQALLYFVGFILLLLSVLAPALGRRDKKIKLSESKRVKILLFILANVVGFIGVPYLEDRLSIVHLLPFLIIFIGLTFVAIFVKIPHKQVSLFGLFEMTMDKLVSKSGSSPADMKKVLLTSAVLAVVYIPIVNYIFNYNSISVPTSLSVRVTSVDGKEYILIKQYADKNILIRLSRGSLEPKYMIQRGDQLSKVSYKIENMVIDNDNLFLKSSGIDSLPLFNDRYR